jgi:hypothetical protein
MTQETSGALVKIINNEFLSEDTRNMAKRELIIDMLQRKTIENEEESKRKSNESKNPFDAYLLAQQCELKKVIDDPDVPDIVKETAKKDLETVELILK